MKTLLLASMLAVGGAATAFGATTVDGSCSILQKVSVNCDSTTCTGPVKMTTKATHQISLTPTEESQLVSDTSVTIVLPLGGAIDVRLDEDPKFQNGDTSAKIKKTIPLLVGSEIADNIASVSLKWGNGELLVKVSTKLKATYVLPSPFPLTKEQTKDTKTPPPVPVVTTVEGPSVTPTYSATLQLLGDLTQESSQATDAEGGGSIKQTISFKSKSVVP